MSYTLEERNYLASRYGVHVPIKPKRRYVRCVGCGEQILARDMLTSQPTTVDGHPMCPVCVWEMGVSYDR